MGEKYKGGFYKLIRFSGIVTWLCTRNSAERWLNFLATQSGRRPVPCPPENANIKLCGFSADTCVASCRYLRRPMQVPAFLGAVSYVFQTVNLHLLVESAPFHPQANRQRWTLEEGRLGRDRTSCQQYLPRLHESPLQPLPYVTNRDANMPSH